MSCDPGATFVALVHHPVRDRTGAIVTTAITNLDLHDIARSCRTYGIGAYFIVHPVPAQRALVGRIVAHWNEDGGHDFRREALARVCVVESLEAAVAEIARRTGKRPIMVATSAKDVVGSIDFAAFRALPGPSLLLLGTGHGLTDELLASMDHVLCALHGPTDYNHLSVRSACAILLDRLYGIEKTGRP